MALCLIAIGTSACSTSVFVDGTSGAGGSTGSTNNATSNNSTGVTTGEGGGACARSQDSFYMALDTALHGQWGCPYFVDSQTGLLQLEGRVVSSEQGKLVIDSCSPAADCAPLIDTLDFQAPGLAVFIPVNSFVLLQARVDIPMGCSHELMIENLPEWDGVPNPVMQERHMWLAAADGVIATLPNAPFAVEAVALGCFPEPQSDDYLLRFTSPSSTSGEVVDLYMGETRDWVWQPASFMTVRNMRSFETGQVDDYWNWGFWISGALAVDL